MSSVGVFRKVEIDEKPYLVYSLLQTDDPTSSAEALAIDSGGDDLPPGPLFLCPGARIKFLRFKIKKDDDDVVESGDGGDDDVGSSGDGDGDGDGDRGDDDDAVSDDVRDDGGLLLFNSSPHFPSTRSGDQQGRSLLDCNHDGICKQPVLPLFWCNNQNSSYDGFRCGACKFTELKTSYYACLQCKKKFHKECVESPLEIIHPSHPFHSLQLYSSGYSIFYHCTICNLAVVPISAMEPIPFVVDHPKSHPHPLTLFLPSDPKKDAQLCQMCKFESNNSKLSCMECDYVICFSCATFPYKARYKHDNHFLTICDGKEASDQPEWCDVCEGKIEEVKEITYQGYHKHPEMLKIERRFYKCNDCSTALHVECLLGKDIYMKPCETIEEEVIFKSMFRLGGLLINLNNSVSRPICSQCRRRCPFPIFYQAFSLHIGHIYCSWTCVRSYKAFSH